MRERLQKRKDTRRIQIEINDDLLLAHDLQVRCECLWEYRVRVGATRYSSARSPVESKARRGGYLAVKSGSADQKYDEGTADITQYGAGVYSRRAECGKIDPQCF
jgi:hypothetical protein